LIISFFIKNKIHNYFRTKEYIVGASVMSWTDVPEYYLLTILIGRTCAANTEATHTRAPQPKLRRAVGGTASGEVAMARAVCEAAALAAG